MSLMRTDFSQLDLDLVPTPCFVVDRVAVELNLQVLNEVQQKSGARILHALKAFSMFSLADLSSKYLSGTCASGINEARLAQEFYSGEIHISSPAYAAKELEQLVQFANHIVFNSCGQLIRFSSLCRQAKQQRPELEFGLRINPEHSEGEFEIYNPCARRSRLGVTISELKKSLENKAFRDIFDVLSGFHFHTLCEQDFLPLQRTLKEFEAKFCSFFEKLSWINFGGGHHITRNGYQISDLIDCIKDFSSRNKVQVYLEPGEAVALGTGVLVAEVLDIGFNEVEQIILNTSATCHMPDVLEMPYRPEILGAGKAGEKPFTYQLGGTSCLAGDSLGEYSFDRALQVGDKIIFEDMSHYTMVKTNTFNGVSLPTIAIWNSENKTFEIVRSFSYNDFCNRLS